MGLTLTVHPHVCGEQELLPRRKHPPHGSSPRMWGTVKDQADNQTSERFIPTYVGNSEPGSTGTNGTTVHPHVCGEQADRRELRFDHGRFIPTYVGNRRRTQPAPAWQTVHPHVCGEQIPNGVLVHRNDGSSPRMWGTALVTDLSDGVDRFIPTYVGNSGVRSGAACFRAVHPHVCGEQARAQFRMMGQNRFIPTYVGNSPLHLYQPLKNAVHPHVCGEQLLRLPVKIRIGGSSPRMWGTAGARVLSVG